MARWHAHFLPLWLLLSLGRFRHLLGCSKICTMKEEIHGYLVCESCLLHKHKSHVTLCVSIHSSKREGWVSVWTSPCLVFHLSACLLAYLKLLATEAGGELGSTQRAVQSKKTPQGTCPLLQESPVCIACHASQVTLSWTDMEMPLLVFVSNVCYTAGAQPQNKSLHFHNIFCRYQRS